MIGLIEAEEGYVLWPLYEIVFQLLSPQFLPIKTMHCSVISILLFSLFGGLIQLDDS